MQHNFEGVTFITSSKLTHNKFWTSNGQLEADAQGLEKEACNKKLVDLSWENVGGQKKKN